VSIPGFDLAQARYDGATPAVRELSDEAGTNCLGFYEQTDTDDAYECDARKVCSGCGGVVCTEHDDDVEDCPEGPAHRACHAQGCDSAACAQERYEDAMLERADARRKGDEWA
jgi:hypothetical protein